MTKQTTLASLAGALMLLGVCWSAPAAAQPNPLDRPLGGWEGLGGAMTSRPVCLHSGYGRIDCFARNGEHALGHIWRNRDQPWSGWQSLGGTITGAPECVSWGARRMDCYARGGDGALWRRSFNSRTWTDWQSLEGFIDSAGWDGQISCTFRTARTGDSIDGRDPHLIDCFVRGQEGALWRRALDGETWSDWQNLGGMLTSPPECVASGLRIHCFVRGADNALWRRAFDGANWAEWENLGGILTSEIDCAARRQRVDCFVRGTDNAVWRRSLTGSTWADWQQVGGAVEADGFNCMVTHTSDLECYAIMNATLQRRVLAGSTWGAWQTVGGGVRGRPDCVAVDLRRIDCFATAAPNGALQHRWWTGSSWQPGLPAAAVAQPSP